ncbi:hypothetical protein QF022_000525 [Vogesella perlucida]|nr:hypothetical protein [Vogesella perlucida]
MPATTACRDSLAPCRKKQHGDGQLGQVLQPGGGLALARQQAGQGNAGQQAKGEIVGQEARARHGGFSNGKTNTAVHGSGGNAYTANSFISLIDKKLP